MVAGTLASIALVALCSNYPLQRDEQGKLPPAECHIREPKLLAGRTIDIVTLESPPLSNVGTEKDSDGNIQGDGVVFEFIKILMYKYGFKYRVSVPEDNVLGDNRTGIIGEVAQGRVDMAAAMLPVFPAFSWLVRFSVGLMDSDWVVLMKRPPSSASGSGLLAPFDDTVWFLILAALICVGPVIYILLLVRWWLARDTEAEASMFPLSQCLWFVFGALMKQGSTLSPITDSSRILFATWWIFITILTSFYTANLTAFLTLSKFTLPIKDAKDIARYRYRWIAQHGGALEHLLDTNEEYDYLKVSRDKGYGKFLKKSDVDMLEEIQKNNLMYLREKNAVEHLMVRDYNEKAKDRSLDEKERCTFVMTPDAFMAQTIAFAYKQEGDLYIPFDKVLLSLVETGIVKFLMRRDLPQVQVCPLDLGSKERQLRNADLWMTYMVVMTGFSTSIAVFAAEMIIRLYRYCNARELQKHEEMAQQYPGDWKSLAFKKSQLQAPYGIFGANIKPSAPGELGMNGQPKIMPMRGSESAFMFQYTA